MAWRRLQAHTPIARDALMSTSVFRRVREGVDPLDYFRDRLPTMPTPRPTGDGWTCGGLCLFHDDKRFGSFRVNVQSGAYLCYACGAAGGDVVAFEAALMQAAPIDAARVLAREWGLE
jgi:DNA primase